MTVAHPFRSAVAQAAAQAAVQAASSPVKTGGASGFLFGSVKRASAEDQLARQALMDSLRDALAVGLLSASLGAGARTMVGAPYLFGRQQPLSKRTLLPTQLPLPIPRTRPGKGPGSTAPMEEEEKAAADKGLWEGAYGGATTPMGVPHYLGLLMLAGGGGAYGGYKLADMLLDRKRKADTAAEVAAAKSDFERTLLAAYGPERRQAQRKFAQAADGTPEALGRDLDTLATVAHADTLTKEGAEKAANTLTGWLANLYLALAVPTALGTGYAAYKYTQARSPNKLLEEALKRRERERFLRHPPEVQARPSGRYRGSEPEEETALAPA